MNLDIQHDKGIKDGSWDSIHVVTVSIEQKKARYRVSSTVFLSMKSNNAAYGDLEISGNLSRSVLNYYHNFIIERELS